MSTLLRWAESLKVGEARVIRIDVTPDTPTNATYTLSGAITQASAPATISTTKISALLSATAAGLVTVTFGYDVGTEHFHQPIHVRIDA